jgi:hypothetical protein
MQKMRAGLLVTLFGVGCTMGQPWSDYRETPIIERGACATVVMPGEQVPLGSEPSCPGGYSSIGGATVYDEKDYQREGGGRVARSAARVPGAILAAPAAAAKRVAGKGAQQQNTSESRGSGAYEQDEIERMRRELAQRERVGRGQTPQVAAAASAPQQVAARGASVASSSIADELATLRGQTPSGAAPPAPVSSAPPEPARGGPHAPDASVSTARPAPSPTAAPVADRVADRDGDGAPDRWIYRDASGRPEREQLDENGDARPDRTAWLDPVTGRETRVEEDSNLDGRVDTWVEYASGAPARQRRDTNYDGIPDVWSYYGSDGKLSRQEQDLDGDGYRNRESLFRGGKLAKQREDRNGDGRFDLVTLYDAEERIARRDEDRDGDGKIDTRSIYQDGKLARREVVAEAIDDGDELSQTEW